MGEATIYWLTAGTISGYITGDSATFISGGPDFNSADSTDTFSISSASNSSLQEHFYIETIVAFDKRSDKEPQTLNYLPVTEVVVSYKNVSLANSVVIAEITNIDEIVIDGTKAVDPEPPDVNYTISGNFNNTELDVNTITILGSSGNDVVDLTGLEVEHGVDLISNGGNNRIIGGNENTTVILSRVFSSPTREP